jgi:hypothetical protein
MTGRWLWPNSSVFILLCCLGLFLDGCGKKGPPKPPQQEELPRVENLEAAVVDNGVRLNWTMGSNDDATVGFTIYRSKVEPEISECPGCISDFEVVTTVRVKAGDTRFQVLDPYFEDKGTFYYKVTPFDKRNRPGPDSNESKVIIE